MSELQPVYQFKILLRRSRPAIWRRVQCSTEETFYDLHKIIINSMEWWGSYQYSFTVKKAVGDEKVCISCCPGFGSGFGDREMIRICAKVAKLSDYFTIYNDKVLYDYCGYEGWQFDVILQKQMNVKSNVQLPRCLTGKRAAPEEITKFRGGIQLHQDFLKYVKEVDHPEYESRMKEIKEVYGKKFKPEVFDASKISFQHGTHGMINDLLGRCEKLHDCSEYN